MCVSMLVNKVCLHYSDVIMSTIASLITSLAVVYSTVYSDADQRKHQSSASLAFVRGIHRDRWIPRTKGQLRGKCFHLMTSSCRLLLSDERLHCFQSEARFKDPFKWILIWDFIWDFRGKKDSRVFFVKELNYWSSFLLGKHIPANVFQWTKLWNGKL